MSADSNVRHATVRVGPANVFYREAGTPGFTTIDEGADYQYTFAGLTATLAGFVNELSLQRFAMYVFDYGAPVGFNLAVRIEPEAYWLDAALLARPGMTELQTDLKLDYKANIARYPLYHQYLRTHRHPLLAMWGKNDTFFIPPGAEAFKRDVPNADVRFLDAGHFARETNVEDVAAAILNMNIG